MSLECSQDKGKMSDLNVLESTIFTANTETTNSTGHGGYVPMMVLTPAVTPILPKRINSSDQKNLLDPKGICIEILKK